MATKPRVLVLGGLGFIGKALVEHIVKNDLASKVRVADKLMLEMAQLTKQEEELFKKVEVVQANLNDANSTAKVFTDSEGDFDYVFNLAAVTKLSQSDEVYNQGITDLSVTVAKEAAKHKTRKFVEASTTEVYKSSSKTVNETGEVKPATGIGKAKAKSEQLLNDMKDLPVVIARLAAHVYGPADVKGLAPRLCIAAVYKKTKETLEYPKWFEEQKMSTVHVTDAANALWHLATNGNPHTIYNVVDKNETDQKKLNAIMEKIFGIKTDHLGTLKSEAMKLLPTETILSEINGEHTKVWLDMLKESSIEYSPLSPYLDTEVLQSHNNAVDGSSIEKTGFSYKHPSVTEELIREEVSWAVQEKWFPAGYL